jgi:perosamine synthetase
VIPLCIPNTDEREVEAAAEVIRSGWMTHGPKNAEFEELFADYIGSRFAVSLNSCTSALHIAIEALGISGEVILPSFTWAASANAVVTAGARPVFADIHYDTCNLDLEDAAAKITSRTEAIMPVHYGGQSCDMAAVVDLAQKNGLAIIEDSAETIGGTFRDQKTGSFGHGCFSFFPTKNLTTGEGGMLTTNDEALAEQTRALIGHGISKTTLAREKATKPWLRSASFAGYNFRMSNILAAIGVEQMKKLDDMNQKRRDHATCLNKGLGEVEEIDLPVESVDCEHVYQMYTVKASGVDRDEFVTGLRQRGIGASVHFDPPVHKQEYYAQQGFADVSLPVTERVASTIVTLPMYPQISQHDLETIVSGVHQVIADQKKNV